MNYAKLEAAVALADTAETISEIRAATDAIREALTEPDAAICGNCGERLPVGCGGLFEDDGVACRYHRKQAGRIDWFFVLPVTGILFLITCSVGLAIRADREWDRFSKAHDCKVVGKISGSTFNTIDAKGNVGIGSTPSKTGYLCNDGITYWR